MQADLSGGLIKSKCWLGEFQHFKNGNIAD